MRRTLISALFLLSFGCDGPAPVADSGTSDSGPIPADGGHDSGPDPAPFVVEATPVDGAEGVSAAQPVVVRFSEAIGTEGTTRVRAGGEDLEATVTLSGDELTITPAPSWPRAAEIEIRLDTDFLDASGQALVAAFVVRFTVDTGAPFIVSSSPADGAADVSVRLGAIRVRFSEPMDQAAGTLTVDGATIAPLPSWSSDEVTFGVSGLAHDTTYRAVLAGFRDLSGHPLEGTTELSFSTGGDDEAPEVIAAAPNEGQVDVSIAALAGLVLVRFDEPMDASVLSAPITVGAVSATASITWTAPDTAQIDVNDVITVGAVCSIDLRGLRDLAGNTLAPAPVLEDGRLDFTTGADAFVPFVAASSPAEGATDVANPLREVRIAFSEAMDESITSVPIEDELGATSTIEGTWSNGGTVLTLPGAPFTQGRTNRIDLRGLRDLSGTALSPVHPYLGDGVLELTLRSPTGESCEQPLGIAQATVTTGSYYEFSIARSQRTRNNGSASCDYDTFGMEGGDAVIHYRKTTPSLSDGGTALRVRTYSVSNGATVEVFQGVCDPRDPAARSAMLRCAYYHNSWDIPLDVGPGDYYIWFSNAASATTNAFRISVEEVATIEEGESCAAPYDSASSIYTAPATAGEPHRWVLPGSAGASVDITRTNDRFHAMSCVPQMTDDAVVRFDKLADDTVLDLRVNPGGFNRRIEVVSGACQRDDPAASSRGCEMLANAPDRLTVRAPAGPVYVWIGHSGSTAVFPGATVEIREIPAPSGPGSSCADAIPISAGASVPITPAHAGRFDGPSCVPVDSGVTWYAFDTTERLTHVRADGAGAIALVDAASGRESVCRTDATTTPLFHFGPIGGRVCVAVESGSSITSLAIEPIDYDGAGASPPVVLPITSRATLEGTVYDDGVLTNESWLRVTPTRILQTIGASVGVLEIPRDGGATVRHLEHDSRVIGRGAAAIGEQLFLIAYGSAVPRLFRVRDTSGAWTGTVWDRGSPAYSNSTSALTTDGVDLFATGDTNAAAGSTPVFRWPGAAPGVTTAAGTIAGVHGVQGIAMDADWIYICGRTSTDNASRGVFRVSRDELSTVGEASATRLASLNLSVSGNPCPIAADSFTSAHYLYVRDSERNVHVLGDVSGPSPRYLGVVFYGDPNAVEYGMDVDRTTGSLYVYSTRDNPDGGEWYRLDP